ncbi:hypothetical protein RDI58_002246 [Solanum bulbocastanum]|uniref:Uncharacterized protein n=1 Tax=Solanum bulbocastanum TaxID=147425 RepID=A0AAN8UFE5_SOLBU
MDIPANSSVMGTKNICILLVLDDFTCHNIVSDMLHNQTYQVLHVGKTMDTLNAVWERKSIFNLVLTNIHRLNSNGVDILQIIKNKLNLPTIFVSPDDTRCENQVQDCSVGAYVVSFSDTDEMNKFWQMVLEKEKGRKAAVCQEESDSRLPQNVTAETSRENTTSADTDVAIRAHDLKGKRKANSDRSEENRDIEKKRRVVWTPKMHQSFLQAIQYLGYEKAVPKKLVEIMNEPGLTREHVASHLQKYRMCIKRAQESSAASLYDQIITNDANAKCFQVQPYLSPLNFSSSREYSHSIQLPFQTHFQQGTGSMNCPTSGQMGSFQQQNSLLDFANLQQADHNGLIGQHSTFMPRIAHSSNFRVYGDKRKNMLFSIQSGNENQPTNSCNSGLEFLGFRLSTDGKSVNFGHKSSSCTVIPNNAYSGLCSSISEDYIHKQQSSQQFLETPIENTLIQSSSVQPENLIFNHPSNSISQQQNILLFDNAVNTISCQIPEMPDSFIPQEQLAAQPSSKDLEDYSAILFGDNEVYVPSLENYDSIQQQYSAPELPQVTLDINSLGTEIDIKSLLETTEDRSTQLFWEENELL